MARLDFGALMRLGLGELRLAPDIFWTLTPVELMLMAGRSPNQRHIATRQSLEELMTQFPDHEDG